MAVIDIGSAAIDRGNALSTKTLVSQANPANESGTITSIEIWAATQLAGCEVATFSVVSGTNLSTRDYETVDNGNGAGVVLAGSKQTFTVDLTVVAGDYIGMYWSSGTVEYDFPVAGNAWFLAGDNIPCTNTTFTSQSNFPFSLYGTGTTTPAGNNEMFMGTNF